MVFGDTFMVGSTGQGMIKVNTVVCGSLSITIKYKFPLQLII